ncbi:MAG: M15 family metallopeptidase [Rikenellaceae bacterium]
MKPKRVFLPIIASIICCTIHAQTSSDSLYDRVLLEWVAGMSISEQQIANHELEELFTSEAIDEVIFKRIDNLSYKDNCTVPISELRYLRILHYNGNGQVTMGEMICNKKISDDLLFIFKQLYIAKYPIESIRLIDEYYADDNLSMINNNSSSFNFRYISGTQKLSNHSLGLAVDINPLYNPYVRNRDNRLSIEPIEAEEYVDRERDFPYKIDTSDLCYKLFIQRGFEWGGDWSSVKDYQHFEKNE